MKTLSMINPNYLTHEAYDVSVIISPRPLLLPPFCKTKNNKKEKKKE